MEPVIVNIQPITISKFGQEEKTASELVITTIDLLAIDNGVHFTFHMMNDANEVVFNAGDEKLTNTEISSWTTTDEQLVDCILTKLKLTKV